jgi:hypothetical protein
MGIVLRPCSLGEDVEGIFGFLLGVGACLALVFHSPHGAVFIGRPACGALDAAPIMFSIIDIRGLDGYCQRQ